MISPPQDSSSRNADTPASSGPKIWRVGTLAYTTGGLALIFFLLLGGDFAQSVRDRAIPPVMQVLFKKFGASNMVTGLVFSSIPAMLSLFVSPIVAYKSDRIRSPWGRRIPFLIVPVPLIVLATIGLAFSPQLGQALSDFLGPSKLGPTSAALIVMSVCWTIFEVGCVITSSLFPALMNDVVPQKVMGLFFGFYRAISLFAGILFFYNVMGQAKEHFTWIFLGIGAIYGVAFTVMCLTVKEGKPPEIDDAEGPRPGVFAAVKTYFREGFGNPYYLWYFAATLLGGLCAGPFNLFSLYYAESIGMSDTAFGRYIGLSYFISLFLSLPIGMAADRYHPLRLSIMLLMLYGVIMAAAGFLVRNPAGFGVAMLAHTVISGSLFTAWASLPQRLLPRARFAEIGSAGGIIGSVVGIFFAPLIGKFLDIMHDDYRWTFYMSAALTFAALAVFVVLHGRFMALGGPKHYVAPE